MPAKSRRSLGSARRAAALTPRLCEHIAPPSNFRFPPETPGKSVLTQRAVSEGGYTGVIIIRSATLASGETAIEREHADGASGEGRREQREHYSEWRRRAGVLGRRGVLACWDIQVTLWRPRPVWQCDTAVQSGTDRQAVPNVARAPGSAQIHLYLAGWCGGAHVWLFAFLRQLREAPTKAAGTGRI